MIRGEHPIYAEHRDGSVIIYAQLGKEPCHLKVLDTIEANDLYVACLGWVGPRYPRGDQLRLATMHFAADLREAVVEAENFCEREDERRRAEAFRTYWAGV